MRYKLKSLIFSTSLMLIGSSQIAFGATTYEAAVVEHQANVAQLTE